MIKAKELDRQDMQTNEDDGGAKGISFGKPLEKKPKSRLQGTVKINLGKYGLRDVRVPRGWKYGPLAGISERGNQFSVSENQKNYLRSWYIFRDNFSPWSYVRVKVEMQFSS
jgi:hypothetical protein